MRNENQSLVGRSEFIMYFIYCQDVVLQLMKKMRMFDIEKIEILLPPLTYQITVGQFKQRYTALKVSDDRTQLVRVD